MRVLAGVVTIVLSLTTGIANAGIQITLSNDGFGGIHAEVSGSGTALDAGTFIPFPDVGDYATEDLQTIFVATLTTPISVDGASSIVQISLDDDSGQIVTDDNINVFLDSPLTPNAPYSFSGASALPGVSFSWLKPGTYSASSLFGPFDSVTLIVEGGPSANDPLFLEGAITALTGPTTVTIDGQPVVVEFGDLPVAIGDRWSVTLSIGSDPVLINDQDLSEVIPGATGHLSAYQVSGTADFTIGGQSYTGTVSSVNVVNDATNPQLPEPTDIWGLVFTVPDSLGGCPGSTSAIGVFLTDRSAGVFDDTEFAIFDLGVDGATGSLSGLLSAAHPDTGVCLPVLVSAFTGVVDNLGGPADDGIEMTLNEIVEIGGAGELWTGSGPLLGQSLSRVVGESSDTLSGAASTVVEGEDFNCVIGVPNCTGAPGVASLTTGTGVGGLDAVHVGSAGDDVVTIDSHVLGTGSIENTGAAPASVSSSMTAEDWSTVYFGIFGGAGPPTIDIDMTYSVAASVSDASGPGLTVPVDVSATGSLGLYDVASLVPDTTTASVTELFGVTATATTANGAAPSLLEATVTLTVNANALYWQKLAGKNEIRLENLPPGLTDVSGLDVAAATFVDPRFEVNAEWAAANPDAAANLVIERTSSTALLDVAIWPWFGGPNLVDVRSRFSVVAVAILGNEAFAAEAIDASSLRFGPQRATPLHWPRPKLHDLDRDGDQDLLVYFKVGATGLGCDDEAAVLSAQTTAGLPVAGADDIRPFPCRPKPQRHHRHHGHD